MYRSLNPQNVIKTLDTLESRISERFPGAGLAKVCSELCVVARQTDERIRTINAPHWPLRFGLIVVLITAAIAVVYLLAKALSLKGSDQLSDAMQGLDAGLNLLIVLGGSAFFLSSIEQRLNRSKALGALHELRSIVHVIDMHQLTKDPSTLGKVRTSSSPERDLTAFELVRYLDYCSEMLSLAAKLAALYAEKLVDPVVVDTVGDIERLTSNLSSKIWQKITIVQNVEQPYAPLPKMPAQQP